MTGGAGFIGSAVVRRLLNRTGCDVCVVDKLTYAGSMETLRGVSSSQRLTFVQADVADAAAMRRVFAGFSPDLVLHLAAESHVDRSIDRPDMFVQTNVVGTAVLLQAALAHWQALPGARRRRFRFHHVSTDEVFGSLGADRSFDETSRYDPRSPSAASKAASDHLVRAWFHTYGLPTIVTHCSNNYGPYQFPEKLIPLMIVNGLEGRALPVYGAGVNVRDWLFVEDHAAALLLVARQGAAGETYCIGGGSERRNIDVVQAICALLDDMVPDPAIGPREKLISYVADRPGHDLRYAVDTTKVAIELAWRPAESFESGLARTVRWFIDNRRWWQPIRSAAYRGERLGLGT